MLWWDEKFMSLVASNNMTTQEEVRYMDDIRVWLESLRLGWRWDNAKLRFCTDWRDEERARGMTGLQKTMEVLEGMMNSICDWLNFTMESVDDFGGMLPTLDLNIWVKEDNMVVYVFYQKPMANSMVIQRRAAMPENMRVATLNQEVIRRMLNTSERLDISYRIEVVDNYALKLANSGYDLEYTRKVIKGGLTGYERKLALSLDINNPKWKPLHQGAKFNSTGRKLKKTLAKTNWFKKRKVSEMEEDDLQASPSKKSKQTRVEGQDTEPEHHQLHGGMKKTGKQSKNMIKKTGPAGGVQKAKNIGDLETVAVIFVDQTKGGALQKRMQEAEDSIALMVGYRVRVVESSGTQLGRLLPYTNPWQGKHCGRESCYTCNQGGEDLQNCRKRNILYESICNECNPEEEGKKKLEKFESFKKQQGVYVGESARSIFERAGEHRRDAQGQKEDSHIYKHWKTSHPELPEAPQFTIKVVASFQDALSRQLSEAVRIDLRGSNILNSKSEYSRCRVPRLRIDKEEWKVDEQKDAKEKKKKKDLEEQAKVVEDSLLMGGAAWDISSRGVTSKKRDGEEEKPGKRKNKKRKLELLVGWGEENDRNDDEDSNQEVVDNWLRREEPPEAVKSLKMKQMEISLRMGSGAKSMETPAPTPPIKLSKEEKLAKAAIGSRKMTDWLVRAADKEWDDDPDLPELEEIEQIEKREQTKLSEQREGVRSLCEALVSDIVNVLEATSSATNIMEEVVTTAWEEIRLESAWRMMQEDKAMQDIILARIRVVEEGRARTKMKEFEDISVTVPEKDINVSTVSTEDMKKLLSMSTEDISYIEKDMCVSNVSTDGNKDIISESTQDIFQSLRGYMELGGGGAKRKLDDPGRWWLPSSWRAPRRRPWPSTHTTSEGRRGGWSRSTDPSRAEYLENEHIRHKKIWKHLKLKLTTEGDGEPGDHVDGGGAQGDGDAGGDVLNNQQGPGEEHQEHREHHELREHREHHEHRDGGDDGQQAGPVQGHQVDGQVGHGGEGVEQQPRVLVRRKVRMKDGVSRDGRLQLSIVNFMQKSGKGNSETNQTKFKSSSN